MFLLEKQIMRDEMSFLSKYDLKKRISQLSLANIYANERKRANVPSCCHDTS